MEAELDLNDDEDEEYFLGDSLARSQPARGRVLKKGFGSGRGVAAGPAAGLAGPGAAGARKRAGGGGGAKPKRSGRSLRRGGPVKLEEEDCGAGRGGTWGVAADAAATSSGYGTAAAWNSASDYFHNNNTYYSNYNSSNGHINCHGSGYTNYHQHQHHRHHHHDRSRSRSSNGRRTVCIPLDGRRRRHSPTTAAAIVGTCGNVAAAAATVTTLSFTAATVNGAVRTEGSPASGLGVGAQHGEGTATGQAGCSPQPPLHVGQLRAAQQQRLHTTAGANNASASKGRRTTRKSDKKRNAVQETGGQQQGSRGTGAVSALPRTDTTCYRDLSAIRCSDNNSEYRYTSRGLEAGAANGAVDPPCAAPVSQQVETGFTGGGDNRSTRKRGESELQRQEAPKRQRIIHAATATAPGVGGTMPMDLSSSSHHHHHHCHHHCHHCHHHCHHQRQRQQQGCRHSCVRRRAVPQ
eukprot:GHVU01074076.1.p1 GENE.GHVU01074076.1~~GHVU01074076.1.p1  ORF type:complete len:519 (+),score=79.40 GHVU01074076.1:167-1558(+)